MEAFDLKLQARSAWVKEKAKEIGFDECGIAKAERLEDEAKFLENWLNAGHHGEMTYLENHFDLRVDPRNLVDGAKSVIVLSFNYYPSVNQNSAAPQISKYAYGKDYHKVIRKRLKKLLLALDEKFGSIQGRGFVDSAPVLEKAWARRAGIGWMGKHTNMLSKRKGSFYFLAVLIVNLDLASDEPETDHCGTCTACIDACPTDAITNPYVLDGSKCISYFTIELKDAELPTAFKGQFNNWMFGCDICQDVCPWNRFSTPHNKSELEPNHELIAMDQQDWDQLTEQKFNVLFEGSAVKRTKYEGLKRNIRFLNV